MNYRYTKNDLLVSKIREYIVIGCPIAYDYCKIMHDSNCNMLGFETEPKCK